MSATITISTLGLLRKANIYFAPALGDIWDDVNEKEMLTVGPHLTL